MFVRYNLHRIISIYDQGKIDNLYIDSNGEHHLAKWRSVAKLLIDIKDKRMQLGMVASRFAYSFIDRTKSTPSLIQTHIDDDQLIPLGKPKSLNILDICLDRADELLKTNKKINIMWSGGVDSTLALFSLIRQARNIDQLNIVCTFESVIESGGMFDSIIKNSGIRIKFDQTRCNTDLPFSYDSEDPSQIYVSGQCADQMFGAPAFLKIPEAVDTNAWHSMYDQNFLDLLEPTLKFSERPIETIYDLRWWAMFNFGWTTVLYDDHIGRPPHQGNRIKSFYATPEFQRWSIHTPTYYETPISYDNPEKYKTPMKQALSCLVDYPYYIKNKGKGLSFTWKKNHNWYLLDRNFKTYYTDQ